MATIRVVPLAARESSNRRDHTDGSRPPRPSRRQLIECALYWAIWALLAALVGSQFAGILQNTTAFEQHMLYGQRFVDTKPSLVVIAGDNDEPYADRNIVCMAEGRSFVPHQLNRVLDDPSAAPVIDRSGQFVHGIRVIRRANTMEMDTATYNHYAHVCGRIADTLEAIQDSCDKMGYNVTRDALRVVDGIDSNTMKIIPRALPMLVLPFWDNAIFAHHAFPGWDGLACDVRLVGKYENGAQPHSVIRGVNHSVHNIKTREWLGVTPTGGVWRNAWLEENVTSGGISQKWFANFQSTKHNDELGIRVHQFDGIRNVELACSSADSPEACAGIPEQEGWGSKFSVIDTVDWYHQVAISNGSRFGVFTYEASQTRVVLAKYTLETFISNVSVTLMLFRWLVGMLTLLNSYRVGVSKWYNAGLGCISCARSFNYLPIALLVRLKFTMAAFWTVGCEFEGQQKALSEAWFAIYPGIAEFMLFYYSLLNFVAKATHRRMSDVLFGPTLLFFCVMHLSRLSLAKSGWFSFDGRITTVILSDEIEALRLTDFFFTNAALRVNGNVAEFVYIKVFVLALNLLPLIFADNMTKKGKAYSFCPPCDVEKSLALRASQVGGLGRSCVYDRDHVVDSVGVDLSTEVLESRQFKTRVRLTSRELLDSTRWASRSASGRSAPRAHTLISYEINRLGYMVFGGKFLISYEDWYILSSLAPFRIVEKLWNHRVIVFEVTKEHDGYYVSHSAELCRLDDERLLSIPFYEVTACAFR